jgi:hypothetical protein
MVRLLMNKRLYGRVLKRIFTYEARSERSRCCASSRRRKDSLLRRRFLHGCGALAIRARLRVASWSSTGLRISCLPCCRPVARRLWMRETWLQVMLLVAEAGRSGERYILSNGFAELADIIANLAALTSAKPPNRHLPFPAAITLATAWETWSRIMGTASPLSVEAIRLMKARLRATPRKLRRNWA